VESVVRRGRGDAADGVGSLAVLVVPLVDSRVCCRYSRVTARRPPPTAPTHRAS